MKIYTYTIGEYEDRRDELFISNVDITSEYIMKKILEFCKHIGIPEPRYVETHNVFITADSDGEYRLGMGTFAEEYDTDFLLWLEDTGVIQRIIPSMSVDLSWPKKFVMNHLDVLRKSIEGD